MTSMFAQQQLANQLVLSQVFECCRYLARQALAFRGEDNDQNSNLVQLTKLVKAGKIGKKTYTHHDIQNEFIQLMSDGILRNFAKAAKYAPFFAVSINECQDQHPRSQMSVVIRYCDRSMFISEVFLGFIPLPGQDSATLYAALLAALIGFGVDINKCRFITTDGAPVVAGHLNGVRARLQKVVPPVLFVYCLCHGLNLVLKDAISSKSSDPRLSSTLELIQVIANKLKYSATAKQLYDTCGDLVETGDTFGNIYALCPTRWTLRWVSLRNFKGNYTQLLEYFDKASDMSMVKRLEDFDTYFTLALLEYLFSFSHNPHVVLQERGQHITKSLRILRRLEQQLSNENTAAKALDFYRTTKLKALNIGCDLPVLRRGSRRGMRGLAQYGPVEESELEAIYSKIYIDVFDSAKNALIEKITSSGLEKLADIELLLCEPTDILWSSVIPTVKNDIDTDALKIELPRFIAEIKKIMGHEHLSSNDIDSVDLELYDLYPNVKLLITFLRTSFVASSEA